MEENQLPENPGSAEPKGCANCGRHLLEEKYPTQLCSGCRELFIKFPIPAGVKIFGIGVGLVLIYALFSLPKNVSLGIHLEKARKYEDKKQYVSAQKEYESITRQLPDNVEANAHLLLAAFYTLDFKTVLAANEKIAHKKIEGEGLLFQLNDVAERVEGYFPDTTLENSLSQYEGEAMNIPDSPYLSFLKTHPYDRYALLTMASRCYNKKDWAGCDSLIQKIFKTDREHLIALRMLATVQREQALWEESVKTCEQILKLNSEASYAYASMARTYLKWNKPAKGLELAEKSMALDKKDPYNMVTLVLAWHYNKQPAKRDGLIKEMRSNADSTMQGYVQYAMDVISNKETL